MRLDDYDRGVLAFEQRWWREPGAKDAAIREQFGITPVRYYQHLARLLDEPAAAAAAPLLIARLRRIRDRRRRVRVDRSELTDRRPAPGGPSA